MRRVVIAALLLLLLSAQVAAKVLVVYCQPATSDIATQTYYVNSRFSVIHKVCGFDYDLVSANDSTAVETKAQSGNYNIAIFLNLPEFDTSMLSD